MRRAGYVLRIMGMVFAVALAVLGSTVAQASTTWTVQRWPAAQSRGSRA
jgi:hypothetical protein